MSHASTGNATAELIKPATCPRCGAKVPLARLVEDGISLCPCCGKFVVTREGTNRPSLAAGEDDRWPEGDDD